MSEETITKDIWNLLAAMSAVFILLLIVAIAIYTIGCFATWTWLIPTWGFIRLTALGMFLFSVVMGIVLVNSED